MNGRYEAVMNEEGLGWAIADNGDDWNGAYVEVHNKKGKAMFLTFFDPEDAKNFAEALNLGQASRDAKKESL